MLVAMAMEPQRRWQASIRPTRPSWPPRLLCPHQTTPQPKCWQPRRSEGVPFGGTSPPTTTYGPKDCRGVLRSLYTKHVRGHTDRRCTHQMGGPPTLQTWGYQWRQWPGRGPHGSTVEVCPTVSHLLWECPGYQDLRAQHLPPRITTVHQWTTPNNSSRAALLSLWPFAHEAGTWDWDCEWPACV